MIVVSVKRYQEHLTEKIADKKLGRLAIFALTGLAVVFGLGFGIGAGYAIYRNGSNESLKIDI